MQGGERTMKRLMAVGLAVMLTVPSLVWAAGSGNPAFTVGKENYGIALEAENQIKRVHNWPEYMEKV